MLVRNSEQELSVFFFSSRRRHTRWNCDWSSDVCSSDLDGGGEVSGFNKILRRLLVGVHADNARDALILHRTGVKRSEERRVGKECRSWWSSDDYTKIQKDTA